MRAILKRVGSKQAAHLHFMSASRISPLEQQSRDLSAAIQSAEQDEARDVAALTAQQDRLQSQVGNATTKAEAATTTALGGQRCIDGTEQRIADIEKQLQAERVARATLADRLAQYEAQTSTELSKKQSGGKRKQEPSV